MNVIPPSRFYALNFLVESLRDSFLRGDLSNALPPERELAAQFNVSRSTLRKALRILAEDGLLIIRQGKPTLVCVPDAVRKDRRFRRVVLVNCSGEADPLLLPLALRILPVIKERLSHMEIEYQDAVLSTHGFRGPGYLLNQVQARDSSEILWIIFYPDERMEKWLAEQSPRACMIIGQTSPELDLACVDVDHLAVGRHAGGLLRQRGCRSVLLVEGDVETTRGRIFQGGLRGAFGSADHQLNVLRLRTESICERLSGTMQKLRSQPQPALVIQSPELVVPIFFHLLQQGIRIGSEISLLCLRAPLELRGLSIDLAHYLDCDRKIVSSVVQQIIDAIHLPEQTLNTRLFLPEFHPGNTVK